jgi:polysaccharide deacetylase 2 family uncharacterized protein YibQ
MKKFHIYFLLAITVLNIVALIFINKSRHVASSKEELQRVENKVSEIFKNFNIKLVKDNNFIFLYKSEDTKNTFLKKLEKNNFFIKKDKTYIKIYYKHKFIKKILLKKEIVKPNQLKSQKNSNLKYLSIIIDDIGPNLNRAKEFWKISDNITLSIIPFLRDSKKISQYAQKHHYHVMLHLPMEPYAPIENSINFLLVNMDNKTFIKKIAQFFNFLPYFEGVNNHMGSKLTCNREKMELFFKHFDKNKFFIDSKTAKCTIAGKIAMQYNIKSGIRDFFIDNKKDFSEILDNLVKAEKLALKKGFAIAIGHPGIKTLQALSVFIADKDKNLIIIPVKYGLEIFANYEKNHITEKEIYEGSSY